MKYSNSYPLLIAIFAIVISQFANAEVEVAQVVFANGEVQVVDVDSRRRYVIKGDLIFAGETIVTGKGRVQVKFTDDGRASLKPDTIYSVSDYYYDESASEPVKSFFELVKGTVRFVSGKIGKRNRANFAIKTKTATIGIRGSSGQVTSCLNRGCRGRLDGTYLTTYDGILFIKSGDSEVEVHPNESAFCGDDGSGCSKIEQAPGSGPVETLRGDIDPTYRQGDQVLEDHGHSEPSYSPAPNAPPPPPITDPHGGGYNR